MSYQKKTFILNIIGVQARNEGRNLAREAGEIIRSAATFSPELSSACEVWKEIKFEFDTVDKI